MTEENWATAPTPWKRTSQPDAYPMVDVEQPHKRLELRHPDVGPVAYVLWQPGHLTMRRAPEEAVEDTQAQAHWWHGFRGSLSASIRDGESPDEFWASVRKSWAAGKLEQIA